MGFVGLCEAHWIFRVNLITLKEKKNPHLYTSAVFTSYVWGTKPHLYSLIFTYQGTNKKLLLCTSHTKADTMLAIPRLSWKGIFNSISVLNQNLGRCRISMLAQRCRCKSETERVGDRVAWDVYQDQVFLLFICWDISLIDIHSITPSLYV